MGANCNNIILLAAAGHVFKGQLLRKALLGMLDFGFEFRLGGQVPKGMELVQKLDSQSLMNT